MCDRASLYVCVYIYVIDEDCNTVVDVEKWIAKAREGTKPKQHLGVREYLSYFCICILI